MSEPACPLCAAPPRIPVGVPFVGTVGVLWRKRSFEERLHRCEEGHVYSVRRELGRGGETVSAEAWESVEEWMRARTGAEPSPRPPGL